MSISSEIRRAGPYSGNGSTTAFAFAFKVFTTAQVVVTRTVSGVETVLTLTTHYTVSLNANQNTNPGGTVTMLTAPAVGQSITITSNVANLQPTAIANLGGFYPEVINDSLDRATIQIQQLDERLDRALVIPVSSSGVSTQLPAPEVNKVLGWNGTGTAVINYTTLPPSGEIYPVATYAALTATPVANLQDDMLFYVASRLTDDDGGAGTWRYDAASTATANGGTILARDGGGTGRFFRLKSGDVVHVSWFCSSGTSQNNATMLQAALDAAAGGVLEGGNQTYRSDSGLTGASATNVRNLTLDISASAVGTDGLSFSGSLGSDNALTSNAAVGATVLALTNVTGLAADDYLLVTSTAVWSPADSSTYSEIVRIASIASLNATLYEPLKLPFNTAASAKVRKITFKEDIVLENVFVVGGGASEEHEGAKFTYCRATRIRGGGYDLCDDRCIRLVTCLDTRIEDVRMSRSRRVGFSYGVAIEDGCQDVVVTGCDGEDLRHLVATGGTAGVSRGIKAHHNKCRQMRDSGFDAHASTDDVDYSYNQISIATGYSGADGIISQSAQLTAIGNIIKNSQGNGIFHEVTHNSAAKPRTIIRDNDIEGVPTGQTASIAVVTQTSGGGAAIESVTIDGNTCRDSSVAAILVQAKTADIKKISITGNKTKGGHALRGIQIRADNSSTVRDFTVADNDTALDGDTGQNIYMQAATATTSSVKNGQVLGNRITNGTVGIQSEAAAGATVERVIESDNIIESCSSSVSLGGTGNVVGDDVVDGVPAVLSGSATWDPGLIADGDEEVVSVTVTGAALGDFVEAVSFSLDVQDLQLSAQVTGTNTAKAQLLNNTGGAIDLGSGTVRVRVRKNR